MARHWGTIMSLKAFHFFFVAMALVLMAGLGVLEYKFYLNDRETSRLIVSGFSFVCALALVVYGQQVWRKFKALGV